MLGYASFTGHFCSSHAVASQEVRSSALRRANFLFTALAHVLACYCRDTDALAQDPQTNSATRYMQHAVRRQNLWVGRPLGP